MPVSSPPSINVNKSGILEKPSSLYKEQRTQYLNQSDSSQYAHREVAIRRDLDDYARPPSTYDPMYGRGSTVTTTSPRTSPSYLSLRNHISLASPTETGRTHSPGYDLRETTARRRSHQESFGSSSYQNQNSPSVVVASPLAENSDNKSESPTRKRRRMSQGLIDLAASPSPPLVRPWQTPNQSQPWLQPSSSISNYNNPRLGSIIERCNPQPRINDRRSPQARRQSQRQRERLSRNLHNNNSNNNIASGLAPSSDRTAFQPPSVPNQRPYPSSTSQTMVQPHIINIIDFNDLSRNRPVPMPVSTSTVPVSIPVSMPTYAVPICTGHTIPGCNLRHGPYTTLPHCNTPHPPPFCGVGHFPLCSVTQLPGCNSHHMPVTQAGVQSFFTHEMLVAHPHIHHHAPPVPYIPAPPHQHPRQPEMELISERPTPFHHVHSIQHTHTLNQSAPMHVIPDSMIRNPTADVLHMHPRLSRPNLPPRRQIRGMWRNPPVPPLLLHYIVPNASVAPSAYGVNLDNENAEVENYEALLNLAERLGEAKPKGLTKSAIDQLPSYRYNPDTHKSHNDQTCCVVCMSEFETRQLLRVLPCSHEFHAKCVDKWLKTNRTCPICRADASDLGNTTE